MMKTSAANLFASAAVSTSILVGSTIANATIYTFDDGTFDTATQTTIFPNPPIATSATATVPCATCGVSNGPGFQLNLLTATGAPISNTAIFIGEPNWIYNPATQGAVLNISGS